MPNVALLDLREHPSHKRRAYAEGLVAAVIELEHQWVRLTAIDTAS
jgi:hypothetical protein